MLAGHSAGGVIATIYAARYPARGVVNVDQPLRVEPFAQLVRSLAGPLRGPGFAQVWAQFEASMGIGLLPQDAQDLLQSARYVRQDLVTGYWREVLDEPPGELALVAFAAAPASWLLARGFSGPLSRAADAERAASGSLASAVEESLANQALIQAFNRQDAESRRLHREGMSWLRATMAETKLDSLYEPLVYFLETCCVLLVFAVGAWDVAGGRLSLAGLLAFAACLAYLYPPVQSLSGLMLSLSEASASAARIGDILAARAAVADEGSALRGRLLGRGRIDVEDVTFGYPDGGRPVLDRLSFTAGPGRLLAITGPSGSGKSTVARLLLRFRDPDAGRILLDGIDVRELSLHTLRYNVTLLAQEALLFPGTVADNIRYGRTGASDDEVAAAARAADAHAFITALPGGYDTPVGQRGRLLSGGQRQRICLARAFLRDAPVLVLDEPTTGLDAASAQRLLAVIRRFAASHTVILITHDPRLTAAADTVLRLAGRQPREQARDWPCVPSPLAEVPARSVLT